jgi:hypothetical protein
MSFKVQYGSSKLPQKFYTGEVDAFWRSETSFAESRRYYLEERDKLRKAQADDPQLQPIPVGTAFPFRDS